MPRHSTYKLVQYAYFLLLVGEEVGLAGLGRQSIDGLPVVANFSMGDLERLSVGFPQIHVGAHIERRQPLVRRLIKDTTHGARDTRYDNSIWWVCLTGGGWH